MLQSEAQKTKWLVQLVMRVDEHGRAELAQAQQDKVRVVWCVQLRGARAGQRSSTAPCNLLLLLLLPAHTPQAQLQQQLSELQAQSSAAIEQLEHTVRAQQLSLASAAHALQTAQAQYAGMQECLACAEDAAAVAAGECSVLVGAAQALVDQEARVRSCQAHKVTEAGRCRGSCCCCAERSREARRTVRPPPPGTCCRCTSCGSHWPRRALRCGRRQTRTRNRRPRCAACWPDAGGRVRAGTQRAHAT